MRCTGASWRHEPKLSGGTSYSVGSRVWSMVGVVISTRNYTRVERRWLVWPRAERSLSPRLVWLHTSTMFGAFRIDPASGVQLGYETVLVRWTADGVATTRTTPHTSPRSHQRRARITTEQQGNRGDTTSLLAVTRPCTTRGTYSNGWLRPDSRKSMYAAIVESSVTTPSRIIFSKLALEN